MSRAEVAILRSVTFCSKKFFDQRKVKLVIAVLIFFFRFLCSARNISILFVICETCTGKGNRKRMKNLVVGIFDCFSHA